MTTEAVRLGRFPPDNPVPHVVCIKARNGAYVAIPAAAMCVSSRQAAALVTAEDVATAEAVSKMDAVSVEGSLHDAMHAAAHAEGTCVQFRPGRMPMAPGGAVFLELPGRAGMYMHMPTLAMHVGAFEIPVITNTMLECLKQGAAPASDV